MEKFQTQVKTFFTEDPKNSDDYSRIVTKFHTERLVKMLDAKNHGGKIVYGGRNDVNDRYIEPTIVLNPNMDS